MPENFLEINWYFALTSYCNTIGQSNNAFSILGFSLLVKRRGNVLIFEHLPKPFFKVIRKSLYLLHPVYIFSKGTRCRKPSLRDDVLVSPSDCVLPTHPHGKICSFHCARGYQVSGPSSSRCGIGGSWSEDANTITCDGLYLDRLSFTSPFNCSVKKKATVHKFLDCCQSNPIAIDFCRLELVN